MRFGHGHRWHHRHDTDRDSGHHGRHCHHGTDKTGDGGERLWGGWFDDQLHGGDGHDWLWGGWGNDQLSGGTGNDRLFGGPGNDSFLHRAGDGHDDVNGGWGHDVLRLDGEDWILSLDRGKVVSHDDGGLQLSCRAAGTITLADGSTVRFSRIERIESVTAEPAPGNQAPGAPVLTDNLVAENAAAGTVVGTVGAADPDAGDTLTYALTDDADGRFAIDPDTGVITVADGARLDHETAAEHSIAVSVTDAGGLGATATFVIAVGNVNEAPLAMDLSDGAVVEGAADGTVVGTVGAADPDAGDTLTYALTDDADGRFAIDPNTGVITVADGANLDFESAAEHTIAVSVTDAGGLSAEATYVIAVTFDNSGDDVMTGDAGDNVLDGGDGDDMLDGGDGDDVLEGGAGHDLLIGGNGVDLLHAGSGDDFAFGDNGNDHLIGGDGDDQLYGGADHDVLDGGSGDDLLQAGTGNDALSGGDGSDTLYGGMGFDTLAGGAGNDTLSGGSEADRFVFASVDDGVDIITDFGAGDVLAIGGMLVGYASGDDAAFVRLVDNGSDTTVQVDPDGGANGAAFSSIAVLEAVGGIAVEDLVDSGQIDFWMS